MKRVIFFAGIILGIIVIAWFYKDIIGLFSKNELRYKAVPIESGFFIDIKGLKELDKIFSTSKMTDKLEGISFYEKTKSITSVFKTLQPRGYSFMGDLLNNKVIIAYALSKPGSSDMICILNMDNGSESIMQKSLDEQTGKSLTYDAREVRGANVWDVKFNTGLGNWTICCYRGLCLLSPSSSLVEEAVVQIKGSPSIAGDKTFVTLPESNNNCYLHLYFNFSRLADFAQGYASTSAQNYLASLSRFDDWNEIEFIPDKDSGIRITGIANSDASQLRFLNNYASSNSIKFNALYGKPDNTAYLESTVLDVSQSDSKTNLILKDADFSRYIQPWFNKEITYVLTEPVEGNFETPSLAFIKTRDAALSTNILGNISVKNGDSLLRLPVHYKEFEINQLQPNGLIGKVVPNAFTDFIKPFYAAAGDYMVFSNSLTQLKLYLERFKDRKTMENMEIPGIKTSSYSEGAAVIYLNLELLTDLFTLCSSDDCRAPIQEMYKSFKPFSPIYLQYTATGNGSFAINGYISLHQGSKSNAAKYIWKTEIDTTYILPPQIILDRNGNEKRVAVQDARNMLYVLNRGGDVIWKKQLDGPVMGDITNIDYYKNEELQMVFATNKKIYITNDDGSPLANFPLTLPANAVAPLSIIDMDNDRNYKFFICCENGNIYGFEKSGKPLAGWNPNAGGKDVSLPVSYFKYHDKEFLMTISNSGTLTFYSRLGNEAYKELNTHVSFTRPFKTDGNRGFSNIINDGTLYRLGFDGRISTLNSPEATVNYAIAEDIDGKPGLEEIFLSNDGLNAYANDSTLLFNVPLSIVNSGSLFFISGHGFDSSIGVKDGGNIYIISGKGKLLNALPKKGISAFSGADLFNNNQGVIVGMLDDNTVIAYLAQ